MKIIHLSDTHLVPPGERLLGLDPTARLAACIDSINRDHADAELCVVTGDLVEHGDAQSYGTFREIVRRLAMPCRLLIGNHDHRANFRSVFPDAPVDGDGFVQSGLDVPAGRLLFLDTNAPGQVDGALCPARLAWIGRQLAEAADRPVYVFMHHPPQPIGSRQFDGIGLLDPEPLMTLLRSHSRIRHLFFGHVHLLVSGTWRGIPFSASRGTCHHTVLDLNGTGFTFAAGAPTYAVALLGPNSTIIHNFDFLSPPAAEIRQ